MADLPKNRQAPAQPEAGTLEERLLEAWIGAKGMLKDSRITRNMTYNEAVVMKLVYDQYRRDGIGGTPVSLIVRETGMLKSLVNRTVNALLEAGYLRKERGEADGRSLFVYPVEARLDDFLTVHRQSLALAREIIAVVGEDDAAAFVRMYEKLSAAGLRL